VDAVKSAVCPASEAVRKQSRRSLSSLFMEGTMLNFALNQIYELSIRSSLAEIQQAIQHLSM
jgi:hypothetical protein